MKLSTFVSAFALVSILANGPVLAQPSSQAGQTRGGGPNACCSDSNEDARKAVKLNNAAQKAIRSPEPVDKTGFGGGKKHSINNGKGPGGDDSGPGQSNPNSANNGKGPGG